VAADIDPHADFSSYQTYAWDPDHTDSTGDPRMDDTDFDSWVRSFVADGLVARGLRETQESSADLLIHYHASVHQRFDVYTVDSERGYEYHGEEEQLFDYEEGTLVLCMVDRSTSRVVWRGYVHTNVEGVMDDPELIEERLTEAVHKVLERFPVPLAR